MAIESVEAQIQDAASVPRKPEAIQRLIADELDSTMPATRARAERLARASDDKGVLCFAIMGLRTLALALMPVAEGLQIPGGAKLLREQATGLELLRIRHCGGPGGGQARREWDAINAAGQRRISDYLHRNAATRCQPVPMPGMVGCAPMREEVYVPTSPEEWAILCATMAAGPVAVAASARLAAAVSGLTWAEVFAVASVAAP